LIMLLCGMNVRLSLRFAAGLFLSLAAFQFVLNLRLRL
jgi:hypothetical protein